MAALAFLNKDMIRMDGENVNWNKVIDLLSALGKDEKQKMLFYFNAYRNMILGNYIHEDDRNKVMYFINKIKLNDSIATGSLNKFSIKQAAHYFNIVHWVGSDHKKILNEAKINPIVVRTFFDQYIKLKGSKLTLDELRLFFRAFMCSYRNRLTVFGDFFNCDIVENFNTIYNKYANEKQITIATISVHDKLNRALIKFNTDRTKILGSTIVDDQINPDLLTEISPLIDRFWYEVWLLANDRELQTFPPLMLFKISQDVKLIQKYPLLFNAMVKVTI